MPLTLEEALSPEWLTSALADRFPGASVVAAELGPVVSRVSTNARFEVTCTGPVPVPRALCIKGYFAEGQVASRRVGEPEVQFYRDLSERTGVRTLHCVYAEIDPLTHHGVVITEDVIPTGSTFLDALSPYTPDQVARSLEQYATLHGATWEAADLRDAMWLTPRFGSIMQGRGRVEISGNFDGPIGALVPDAVRDTDQLLQVASVLPGLLDASVPWSGVHGDAHVGNVFIDGTGQPALVDWQLVQRGPWYLDVGYHIASALTIADRRANERDLLAHYLDCLVHEGANAPSRDEAWTDLSVGIVYGLYLWAITLKVAPPITTAMLERLGTAALDHDAYATVLARTTTLD